MFARNAKETRIPITAAWLGFVTGVKSFFAMLAARKVTMAGKMFGVTNVLNEAIKVQNQQRKN